METCRRRGGVCDELNNSSITKYSLFFYIIYISHKRVNSDSLCGQLKLFLNIFVCKLSQLVKINSLDRTPPPTNPHTEII